MSAANDKYEDAREALAALLEGTLTSSEQIVLEARIQSDPGVCAEWVVLLRQDVLLGEVLAEEQFTKTPVQKPVAPIPKSVPPARVAKRVGKLYWLTASAAGLVFGVFGWLLLVKMGQRTDTYAVAERATLSLLKGEAEIERAGAKLPAKEGMEVQPGDKLRMLGDESGAEVVFSDGSKLLSGRMTAWYWVPITNRQQQIILDYGTVVAEIQKQVPGSAFVVSTPEAVVTVLGTRFRISEANFSTTLDLFEGKVRFHRRQDANEIVVDSGQRVVATREVRRPLVATPLPSADIAEQSQPKSVPTEKSQQKLRAVLVTAAPMPMFAHDVALKSALEKTGFVVREVSFERISVAEALDADLVVVPSHKCSNRKVLREVAAPVIAWHNVWHQDLGLMDYDAMNDEKLVLRPVSWANSPPPAFGPLVRTTQPEFDLNIYSSLPELENSIPVLNLQYSPGRSPLVLIPKNTAENAGPRVAFCIDIREGSGKGAKVETSEELFNATVRWCLAQREIKK